MPEAGDDCCALTKCFVAFALTPDVQKREAQKSRKDKGPAAIRQQPKTLSRRRQTHDKKNTPNARTMNIIFCAFVCPAARANSWTLAEYQ
jgi:hypothetical protein